MNVLRNEYDQQAVKFLEQTDATIKTRLLGSMPYFDGDKENRDVYEVTIERKGRNPWVFRFGQSLMNSREFVERSYQQRLDRGESRVKSGKYKLEAIRPPSAYDVLAAVTKYDPGTFEDFCADMGLSTDSRSAEKTYFAVQNEYANCVRMFGDVLEGLQVLS